MDIKHWIDLILDILHNTVSFDNWFKKFRLRSSGFGSSSPSALVYSSDWSMNCCFLQRQAHFDVPGVVSWFEAGSLLVTLNVICTFCR